MINHARTLLLNVKGGAGDSEIPGEQLIPSSFAPVRLPTYLKTIRQTLFGTNPDRAMHNYRAAQLMNVLHATELADYVVRLDRRITYTAEDVSLFNPTVFLPVVSAVSGTTLLPAVFGTANAPDTLGTARYSASLTLSGTTLTITYEAPPATASTASLTFTGGLSQSVGVGRSGYSLAVPDADGAVWRFSVINRPQLDLGQILAMLTVLGQPTLVSLFGASLQEPYKTFSNLFYKHTQLAYRLGGLLMAVIYRTDELFRISGTVAASTIEGDVPVASIGG